jgi:hypothetical protein
MCISSSAVCNSPVHGPLQNRLLICMEMYVSLLAPRIWRWLLDFWNFFFVDLLPKWAFYYSPTSSINFGRWKR